MILMSTNNKPQWDVSNLKLMVKTSAMAIPCPDCSSHDYPTPRVISLSISGSSFEKGCINVNPWFYSKSYKCIGGDVDGLHILTQTGSCEWSKTIQWEDGKGTAEYYYNSDCIGGSPYRVTRGYATFRVWRDGENAWCQIVANFVCRGGGHCEYNATGWSFLGSYLPNNLERCINGTVDNTDTFGDYDEQWGGSVNITGIGD